MPKIAVSTSSFGEYQSIPLELCKKLGYELVMNPYKRTIKPGELIELAKDAVGLIAGTESITKKVLLKLPRLRVISRCGAGLDNIDADAARELGIKIFNTPDAPTTAVAELTIGLMLNLLRKVNQADASVKSGRWKKLMGNLIYGKKIGIIGLGRIGRKVVELLKPFGCEIKYADPFLSDGLVGLERLPMERLLLWADIISIHVSENREIIGRSEISHMKKGAWLVNVSRGCVVNEEVLYQSLKTGHLSGAALDVFGREPYEGCLKELHNVILTPHIGSYAIESRVQMEMGAANNLLKGLEKSEAQK